MSAGCQNTSRPLVAPQDMCEGCPCATMPGTFTRLRFVSHPGNPSWGPGSQSSVLTGHTQGFHKRAELFATNFFYSVFSFYFGYHFINNNSNMERKQRGEPADPYSPFNSPQYSTPAMPYFASCWEAAALTVSIFSFAFEKWRLENAAADKPLSSCLGELGEFQPHGRQARPGMLPWPEQGLGCTSPAQPDLGFQHQTALFPTPLHLLVSNAGRILECSPVTETYICKGTTTEGRSR